MAKPGQITNSKKSDEQNISKTLTFSEMLKVGFWNILRKSPYELATSTYIVPEEHTAPKATK